MSEDNQQEKNKDKKPQESIEEFCKRQGGVEFAPFHGGNLMHKKPKKEREFQRQAASRLPGHASTRRRAAVRRSVVRSTNSFNNHSQLRRLNIVSGRA